MIVAAGLGKGNRNIETGTNLLHFCTTAVEWAFPLVYLLCTLFGSPFLGAFQLDADEGINAMKAFLVGRGDSLYSQIWNDQPPLMSVLLVGLFRLTGQNIVAGRVLVLVLSCTLLWACARFARLTWGPEAAVVIPFLILVLPLFQQLSVSLMIGLPALAFGGLALLSLAEWHVSRRSWLPFLSGLLFGLSIMTKLFTAFLGPIFVAGMVISGRCRKDGALCPVFLWLAGLALVILPCLGIIAARDGLGQLIESHLAAAGTSPFRGSSHLGPQRYIERLWLLQALAIAGIVLSWRKGKFLSWYVVAWAVAALAISFVERPFWNHHQLLFSIPLALLASVPLVKVWDMVRETPFLQHRGLRLGLLALMGSGAVWAVAATGHWKFPGRTMSSRKEEDALVSLIRSLAGPSNLMVTDLPMFAFRAGIAVPPQTAVISEKRLRTGYLTEAELRVAVEKSRPALVLLGRFEFPDFRDYLRTRYDLVHVGRGRDLFLTPGRHGQKTKVWWPDCLDRSSSWFSGPEAQRIAGNILASQHTDGGWAKNEDRTVAAFPEAGNPAGQGTHLAACSSIDNRATTAELLFLARSIRATGDSRYIAPFTRGLDFLLRSQSPTGGWPQVPAAPSGVYQSAITFNDNAMVNVLQLMRSVAEDPSFVFVDPGRREQSGRAFRRGIDLILRTQVVVNGARTVWCGQHDPVTLRPAKGRLYEPVSLCGEESVEIIRLLMSLDHPDDQIVQAIDSAVRWFAAAPLVKSPSPDIDGPEPLWARFYGIENNQPLFPDRNGVLHDSPLGLSPERRAAYRYLTSAPRKLLQKDYPQWKAGGFGPASSQSTNSQ